MGVCGKASVQRKKKEKCILNDRIVPIKYGLQEKVNGTQLHLETKQTKTFKMATKRAKHLQRLAKLPHVEM